MQTLVLGKRAAHPHQIFPGVAPKKQAILTLLSISPQVALFALSSKLLAIL